MALGNGGLGRLAACFIDSLATLNYPAVGYGIHYEHGLFRQEIQDGRQIERPDSWREYGNPWEICRPESVQRSCSMAMLRLCLATTVASRRCGTPAARSRGALGYPGGRLWRPYRQHPAPVGIPRLEFFDWDVFNAGGYIDSQAEKAQAETISKVLYPNDETDAGKELRLIQQYFFCACSIKDIMRRYKRVHGADFSNFAAQIAIQLNDTHPTVAIPELMRVLVDEEADLGRGLGHQLSGILLHQPHPAAGSAGEVVGQPVREGAAPSS